MQDVIASYENEIAALKLQVAAFKRAIALWVSHGRGTECDEQCHCAIDIEELWLLKDPSPGETLGKAQKPQGPHKIEDCRPLPYGRDLGPSDRTDHPQFDEK